MATTTAPRLHGIVPERIRLYLDTSQSDSDNTSVEYVRTTAKSEPQTSAVAATAPLPNPSSISSEPTPNKRKYPKLPIAPAPKRVPKLAKDCAFMWLSPPNGEKVIEKVVKDSEKHRDDLGRPWAVLPVRTKTVCGTIITARASQFGFPPPRPFETHDGRAGPLASFMFVGPRPLTVSHFEKLSGIARSRYRLSYVAAKDHEDQLFEIYNTLVQERNGWANPDCCCSICIETS